MSRSFGRYRVVRPLGEGATAEVFEVDDGALGVRRALKVLHPEVAQNDELRARFEAEARTLAQLRHPHLVAVHDVGEADGRPWLVMDLAERGSLADRVAREGPMAPEDVLRELLGVLDALAIVHAAGVIHRDIKPQNLLYDAAGHLRLADFGIALTGGVELTRTGMVLGSWGFMAPEQRLDPRKVRPATDLFGVAASAVWAIVGGPVSDLHVSEHRATLLRDVSDDVSGVLHRALAFRPEERFRSAGEMKAAVEGVVGQKDVSPDSSARPAERSPETARMEVERSGSAPASRHSAAARHQPRSVTPARAMAVMRGVGIPTVGVAVTAGLLTAWVVADDATPHTVATVGAPVVKPPERCSNAPATYTTSMYPRRSSDKGSLREAGGAVFGDADGDGRVDLVVPHQLDEALLVFWGDGTPILGRSPERVPSRRLTTGEPHSVAIGDVTGDGIPDIVAVAVEDRSLVVHPGLGGRTFAPPTFYETGEVPTRVFLTDLDTDGDLDALLLLVASGVRKLSWRENVAGKLSDSLPLVFGVTAAIAQSDHVWVVESDELRAMVFNRSSRQLDIRTSVPWTLATSDALQVVGSGTASYLLGWSARWGVPSPAVRAELVDGAPATPCALDLPQGRIQDVADIGDDGHIDVALVETCAYCTSNYMVAVGR